MSRYTINQIEYPSVTEITGQLDKSEALIPWAVNATIKYIQSQQIISSDIFELAKTEFRNISDEACDIGSQVHDLIECYIKNGKDKTGYNKYSEQVQNAFLAFLDWEKENKIEWIESEMQIHHSKLCYAGTLDSVCIINGKKYVIDFKTSKNFYKDMGMQIAAYADAYAYNNPEHTNLNIGILRIDKLTGIPEFKDYTKDYNRLSKSFNNLLDFYYNFKKRRLKNNGRAK